MVRQKRSVQNRIVPRISPSDETLPVEEEIDAAAQKSRKLEVGSAVAEETAVVRRRSCRVQRQNVEKDISSGVAPGKIRRKGLDVCNADKIDGSLTKRAKKSGRKPISVTREKNNAEGEPGICTRCNNKIASMDHFYRIHNGLLAEEQRTFTLEEKHKRYLLVQQRRLKFHCQNDFCKKVLNSVTAMLYHQKVCGKESDKVSCNICGRSIQSTYFKQHVNEHNRALGEYQRRGKWTWGTEKTKEKEVAISRSPSREPERKKVAPTKEAVDITEEEPTTSRGRPKRTSAIVASRRFQKIARSDTGDSDEEEEHQVSDVESEDDSDNEGGTEVDEASPEEEEKSEGQTTTCNKTRHVNSTFIPNRKFPGLGVKWQQTLKVLGYALCETVDCDFIGYTLAEMLHHVRTCQSRRRTRLQMKCVRYNCKFSTYEGALMVKHHIRAHGESTAEAERLRDAKKVPFEIFKKKKYEPARAEIDALKLFE